VVLFLPETLRSLVGDGSIRPPRYAKAVFEKTVSARGNDASAAKPKAPQIDFLAPLRVLVVPRLAIVLLCLSLHYASWQMALTVQSSLFDTTYGLSEIMIGVTFLANGAGSIIGALVTGRILDRDYRRADKKSKADGVELPLQKVRLRTIVLWAPICWASVLVFGWSIDQRLSIAAPIVVSLLLSWSAMSIQAVISTYIIDVFPDRAASATAALNLARCAMGAVATATVGPAMQRLGTGWTSTLWTGLMAVSSVLLFYCV
jgi:predicted MFS family arabinose efflux permease